MLSPVQRRLEDDGKVIELIAGDWLDQETSQTCIGFVLSGQLQVIWRDGEHENRLYLVHSGDWFGVNNLILKEPLQTLRFQSIGFTRALVLEVGRLVNLLKGDLADLDGPLRDELKQSYARRWKELAEHHHDAVSLRTDDLVIRALEEAANFPSAMSHPEGTLVKIGREELAWRIGRSRGTVSRALSRLEAAGRIRLEGRRILLLGHQGRMGAE